jgi:hypothetical protein
VICLLVDRILHQPANSISIDRTIVKRPLQATLHHIQRKLNSRKVLVFLENINDRVGCCYSFFGSYKKIRKYKKQYKKIFKRNPKNNRSEKKKLEC